MDQPPPTFTGRRRSSVISLDSSTAPSIAPRKASTYDSSVASSVSQTASDISARRATAADPSAPVPYDTALSSISGRKASTYDNDDPSLGGLGSSSRVSASDIAARRATALDRPPWDLFAGAPPSYDDSSWGWMSQISAITKYATSLLDRNKVFYAGNMNYIFEHHNEQHLSINDLEAIMNAYGVDETSVQDIVNKVDGAKQGSFFVNPYNKQILLAPTINFSNPLREPLNNLRQASKCFQKNLLSPLHFAGYIIEVLKAGNFLEEDPRFMILGIYSVLGVLEGSTNPKLSIKDVETFVSLWRVRDADEAQGLINLIHEDFHGSISSVSFYNLLYRRNAFGQQRIQMFNIEEAHQDPSAFFKLMDKDGDGFFSPSDLRSFAASFGRTSIDNKAIDSVLHTLDSDGDGRINCEDFRQAMVPILSGLTWEFWVVALLLTLKL